MDQLTEHQTQLEELFSNNQLMPRMRKEFTECESFDFTKYLEHKAIDVKFGIDLLVQMALHKRCDLQTLVGTLRHHCESAQEVVNNILKCAEADLVDYNVSLGIFIVRCTISNDVQEELDRFQYPLPMVVEPKKITNNKQSGYLLNNKSIILKDNHHEDDVCLDHINRLNKIKFRINFDTARMVKNEWRNLDKRKEGETQADFIKRKKAFEKYDSTARDVMEVLHKVSDTFHLTHSYDKRLRTYAQGYHVNYQGTAWNKAVIEFAEEEVTNG